MSDQLIQRKEKMMIAAIEILDRSGLQGLTAKEIARAEGLSEAAVYRHFSSKKEILHGIVRRFTAYDAKIGNTMLKQQMNEEEGIRYFVRAHMENLQGYPQIATVLFSFDLYRYDPDLKHVMKNMMVGRRQIIEDFICLCRAEGRGCGVIEAGRLADLLLGCMMNSLYLWKLTDCLTDVKEEVMGAVNVILERNKC